MKDGFDTSVAQRMPKMQKRRPNRPWNVDPVLIKPQEEIKEQTAPAPAAHQRTGYIPHDIKGYCPCHHCQGCRNH